MKFFIIPFLLLSFGGYAQCKSYQLNAKRDTVNCIDQKDLRQGMWVNRYESLRGEPGYEEEGLYKDGKKESVWRLYSLMGDLVAVERFRWGNKDGISQYYSIAGIIRQESWKAVNPDNPYDTVDVPDPLDDGRVQRVVVKMEGSSVKHGTWKFYQPGTGELSKTENYFLDKLEDPNKKFFDTAGGEVLKDSIDKPKPKVKPAAVLEFEKKNAGKKTIKTIDGRTGN